jgi:hypothetical protein
MKAVLLRPLRAPLQLAGVQVKTAKPRRTSVPGHSNVACSCTRLHDSILWNHQQGMQHVRALVLKALPDPAQAWPAHSDQRAAISATLTLTKSKSHPDSGQEHRSSGNQAQRPHSFNGSVSLWPQPRRSLASWSGTA